uniref:Uncharacterized protein n=1 Tax=Bracon brevicornis TaxID=1563983 RepID=A0A6V7KV06_9HYME
MRGLFARLDPPWTEQEQVDMVHANLPPVYRMWLRINRHTIISELEKMVIQQDSIYHGCDKRKPPPAPETSMCPAYAYPPPKDRAKAQSKLVLRMMKPNPPPAKTDTSGSDDDSEDDPDKVDPDLLEELIKA